MKRQTQFMLIILALNVINVLTLWSALHTPEGAFAVDIFTKQLFWMIAGWVLLWAVSHMNHRSFYDGAVVFYLLAAVFLLMVMHVGDTRLGAQRWIGIGAFSFQPSEFAKIAAMLMLSRALCRDRSTEMVKPTFFDEIIKPFLPTSVLFVFIFLQPDLGTALVILFMYVLLLLANRITFRSLLIIGCVAAIVVPAGWLVMKPYQKQRIFTFLDPEKDPLGSGYNIIQSKIAVGSGGVWGKGWMAGTQNQLDFIPERHTDFIFATFSEERGFVGCAAILMLFFALLRLILTSAERISDPFTYNLCIGIFSLFFIHCSVNMGMVMGLLPVVGIPLAFFSYGGSYMLLNFFLSGLFLGILNAEDEQGRGR